MLGEGLLGSLANAIDASLAVLASPGDARVIVFTLVIGAFILTLERSRGCHLVFIRFLEQRKWVDNGKRAQWMAWFIGILIFIESNITVLVAGTVSRPLFDRFKVSREKLAYLIDSTSAPICMLIPLNCLGRLQFGFARWARGGTAAESVVVLYPDEPLCHSRGAVGGIYGVPRL